MPLRRAAWTARRGGEKLGWISGGWPCDERRSRDGDLFPGVPAGQSSGQDALSGPLLAPGGAMGRSSADPGKADRRWWPATG